MFLLFKEENSKKHKVDSWIGSTVALRKGYLGTLEQPSKAGYCVPVQIHAAVSSVVLLSPLAGTACKNGIFEQWPQQHFKYEQFGNRPQFLQHCMFSSLFHIVSITSFK
ncbi:unnamed protein product [Thelazia callipaeda]|uniref:Ovule protein n=1 Tax=Thelazia callipaeda TaxID=103827 RepID=A0A0N5CYK6_THECL|nr:unnamed protein product [Thelazia callipaeda]